VAAHLNHSHGFFKRLWYGIKYIFGCGGYYSHFEETVLGFEKVSQLRNFCDAYLAAHSSGKEPSPELKLKWEEKMVELGEKWLAGHMKALEEAKALVNIEND
jgi:hypothetical protein